MFLSSLDFAAVVLPSRCTFFPFPAFSHVLHTPRRFLLLYTDVEMLALPRQFMCARSKPSHCQNKSISHALMRRASRAQAFSVSPCARQSFPLCPQDGASVLHTLFDLSKGNVLLKFSSSAAQRSNRRRIHSLLSRSCAAIDRSHFFRSFLPRSSSSSN